MTNFIIIFSCLFAGIFCKRLKKFHANTAQVLNTFVIYISLPALILSQMPKLLSNLDFHGKWWLPISMAWIAFLLSFLFFNFIGKRFHWSRAKIGALILTAGLGNTSFVGIPLLEALLGHKAVPIGIMVDQPGSFLVLSTLGILIASIYSGSTITVNTILKRVFSFPPFIALIGSILWAFGRNFGFEIMNPVFLKISTTLVPLALFSVGFQLNFDFNILKKRFFALSIGLLFKLVLMPIFFSILYFKLLGGNDLESFVTVIESAMATMITSAVVAAEFNLDTEIANLMVGISIPLSLISVPIWNYFLK